jgi:hypothetical protein
VVAVNAIQNYFLKKGLNGRLARQVARATDELLLNAIFSAPRDPSGVQLRANVDRDSSFSFDQGEKIVIRMMSEPDFFGLSVTDFHGSLRRQWFADMTHESIASEKAAGEELGLNSIMESGLSMYIVTDPGCKTEVMLIFPRVRMYKEFKNSFRFFGATFIEK